MRALAALWLMACGAPAPVDVTPPASPVGPPWVTWLEPERTGAVLVVMPLRALDGSLRLRTDGGAEGPLAPGRHTLTHVGPIEVEVAWHDPHGRAAARALLRHPPLAVTGPRFEPIVPVRLGHEGPAVDQAVRIR